MAFKFVAVLCLASLASAGHLGLTQGYHGGQNNGGYNGGYSNGGQVAVISHGDLGHGNSGLGLGHGGVSSGHSSSSLSFGGGSSHGLGGGNQGYSNGGHGYSNGHDDGEQYGPAHYAFDYSVHDEHTGDIKEQKEQRDGDRVEGYYSLVEPDGHKRIVHYQSDKHSGFNAQVSREYVGIQAPQQVQKVIAAPVAIKKIVSAPVLSVSHGGNYGGYNAGSSLGYNGGSSHGLNGGSSLGYNGGSSHGLNGGYNGGASLGYSGSYSSGNNYHH